MPSANYIDFPRDMPEPSQDSWVPLWLVIEGDGGTRRYETDNHAAWSYYGDATDTATGLFETVGANDVAYFTSR